MVDPFSVGIGGAGAIVAAAGAIVQVVNFAVGTSGSVATTFNSAASTLDDDHVKRLQARSGGQLKIVHLQRHHLPFTFYRKSVLKEHVDRATIFPRIISLISYGDDEAGARKRLDEMVRNLEQSEVRVQIPLQLECEIVGFQYRQDGKFKKEFHVRSAVVKAWHDDGYPYLNYFQERASLQFSAHGNLVDGVNASYVVFSWHFRSEGRRFRASGGEMQGDLRLSLGSGGQAILDPISVNNIKILDGLGGYPESLPIDSTITLKTAKPAKEAAPKDAAKDTAAKDGAAKDDSGKDGSIPIRDTATGMTSDKVRRYAEEAAGYRGVENDADGRPVPKEEWVLSELGTKEAVRRYVKDRYGVPISYAPAQLRLENLLERYESSQWILFLAHHTGDLYGPERSPLLARIEAGGVYRSDEEVAELVRRVDGDLEREFASFVADRMKATAGTGTDRAKNAEQILDDYREFLAGLIVQLPAPGTDREVARRLTDAVAPKIVRACSSGIVEIARVLGLDPELERDRVERRFADIDALPDSDRRISGAVEQLASFASEQGLNPAGIPPLIAGRVGGDEGEKVS
ncbi:hypothetical protein [Kribbella sp. NPDC055071]